MLTIIHGDNIAESRNYFTSLRNSSQGFVSLQGSEVTITDLAQILGGGTLFEESKSVFIEELFAKKKSSEELKSITESLSTAAKSHTIVLWENKELTKTQLRLLKDASVKVWKLPQSLFQFLDALKPRNGKLLINLFHKTLESSEIEMVFFLIVRQIRILLALFDDEASIDEVRRLAPWQKSKLQKQSQAFTAPQLKTLFRKLCSIDTAMKIGQLDLPLPTSIDILLLEI